MMIRISPYRIPVRKNRRLALIIHYFLKMCFLFYWFLVPKSHCERKPSPLKGIKRILVIRIDGLGDMVMSTPGFKAVRGIFPNAHITLLAANWSRDLVEEMPTFDEVIYFDAPWIVKGDNRIANILAIIRRLRREQFDLAIDLRADFRNNLLMYLCKARYRMGFDITGCGFLLTHIVPAGNNHHSVRLCLSLIDYLSPKDREKYNTLSLWIREVDRGFAVKFLKENNINYKENSGLVVIIHPGSRWYGRRWKAERYAKIADCLIEKYGAVVILGGSPGEVKLVRSIAKHMKHLPIMAAGKTSLRQFLALLEKADLFIGVDSGPMHMATAMRTRVIALFGPASPSAVGPIADGQHAVVTKQESFACSPCAQTVCHIPNNSCMSAITIEDVWTVVEAQVKGLSLQRGIIR